MEALIKLNINDLSTDFINKLKALFPGVDVEIKLNTDSDETAFILSNPAFANELRQRIAEVENNKEPLIIVNESELL